MAMPTVKLAYYTTNIITPKANILVINALPSEPMLAAIWYDNNAGVSAFKFAQTGTLHTLQSDTSFGVTVTLRMDDDGLYLQIYKPDYTTDSGEAYKDLVSFTATVYVMEV